MGNQRPGRNRKSFSWGKISIYYMIALIKTVNKGARGMKDRDEIIVIPEQEGVGGFMCPMCLSVAIGAKWASHVKYCPDCGQRIHVSTTEFNKLRKIVQGFTYERREKCCKYYSVIGPENKYDRQISGIYRQRIADMLKDDEQIEGQMNITDFL